MAVIITGATTLQANGSKLRRPLGTVDLEELPNSRERTGAPVLWLSCDGQKRCMGAVLLQFLFERHL